MANNKVSPITLQSNDVATLGSQGNSIIAHNNGLTSIRAAGNNESAAVDPFNDDCSGIYASPGGISLNTKATQTNYQTIGSTQTQQNNPNNIVQANIPIPSVSVTLPIQAPKPSLLPSPTPTPTPSVESEFIDMVFLPEREDSPVKFIIIDNIPADTYAIPDGLVEKAEPEPYTGPTQPYTISNNKLIVSEGVLVGTNGDVNQAIILPNPVPGAKPGTKLPDKYKGLIPVKTATHSNKLISFTNFISTCKKIGLTQQQARNCFALCALEAGKIEPYFTGWNNNFAGLQAEGKWRQTVSQYIDYRYIAKDAYGLRIFAGFNSVDRALASKAEAMRFKGLLDATDANAWGKLYRCTWVSSGCNDANKIKAAIGVYNSWGKIRFDKYNKSY
jgi:hypothetical protein